MTPRPLAEGLTDLGPRRKAMILLLVDGVAAQLATTLVSLTLPGEMPLWLSMLLTVAGVGLGAVLGLHRMKLRTYRQQNIPRSLNQGLLLALLLSPMVAVGLLTGAQGLVFATLFAASSIAGRLLLLHLALRAHALARRPQRVLIWGAGRAGQQLAAALSGDEALRVQGFVDQDLRMQGKRLAGVPVHPPARAVALVARLRVDLVVLALPPAAQAAARQALAGAGCDVETLPGFAARLWGRGADRPDMATLLGRAGLDHNLPEGGESYVGQVILVTGAGGSIGAELSRQLSRLRPRGLVLLDHSELALYEIARELEDAPVQVLPVLGSVCDAGLIARLLAQQRVQVIFHAAAYKHVPLVQLNPLEGIRNNVLGTQVLAEAAARAGVGRMILISSDKAVRPVSVMGATKRMAELIVQDLAARGGGTRFAMVRFGNVMGSSGSVVPLFTEQISRGGPVTVTHPQVTRYFMSAAEAVRLTLLAGHFAIGGEVFVLDMGRPQKILDLARQMIRGAGMTPRDADHPEGDIEIRFTGLRPGEKLEEELLIAAEMLPTPHPRILRAQEAQLATARLHEALADLSERLHLGDAAGAMAALMHWTESAPVPDREALAIPPPDYRLGGASGVSGRAGWPGADAGRGSRIC
ncbi:polysaccharide biosynthesis protein [Oceanicola sp. S124]|uniref:polysaccharide biosynthesis protein n=1 Tax=Oceanicola sp. S124 TaxID=1042378 RepID=UPI0002557A83|nr:nucleoside-diphosphate sugar epimerase/dehydratase [Oceanicola sp. S124]